ncbi:MAG: PKD domain-containing protein, partial [Desulfobacterales bacterium]
GNLPPLADAGNSVGGTVGRAIRAITFDGTGSSDPDGTIAKYDWYFGDGTIALDAGPNPTHSYTRAGKYFVVLTVTDSDGAIDSDATLVDAEQGSGGGGDSGLCFINTIMGK